MELRNDGTYTHIFVSDKGDQITNSGSWEFYQNNDGTRILFREFQFATSKKFGVQRPSGEWPAIIEKCGFSLCIPVALDFDYKLKKE